MNVYCASLKRKQIPRFAHASSTYLAREVMHMPRFKDAKDREWSIEINIGTTMRLKADGVQFHELAENKYAKFLALEKDDEALARMVWAIIKPLAEVAGVIESDFVLESLFGESLFSAWEAFGSAYINFIRDPAIRSSLTSVMERGKRLQTKAAAVIEERFAKLETAAEKKIAEMAETMSDERMGAMLDEQFQSQQSPPSRSNAISSASPAL